MTDKATAAGRQGVRRALKALLPYLWPAGRTDLRLRIVGALVCLAVAKLANVATPLVFKQAVDALDAKNGLIIAVPLGLLAAYGLARLGTVLFEELREALFSRIKMRAMRRAALSVFQHLHALSLRFHLERRTGGLSRVIERGVKGIEFILDFSLFNILPTLLEILLVCGILWGMFDFYFSAVTLATITAYIAFTLIVTEWRLKFRRHMNARDTEANSKAVDSLLNYETVKYFGNEGHEAARFDRAMRGYEQAAVRSILSLSLVNIGQGLIIALGLVALMAMAGHGVAAGTMTLGDFVLVNTYLIQLYMPLNFLGFVYRQIRQSLTDMEDMFALLDVEREVADRPGARVLYKPAGTVSFESVHFGYDPRRPILRGLSFHIPAGGSLAVVGSSGAGKSTLGRLLFRFYDVDGGAVRIDGIDIRALSQRSLRTAIGMVPQDTVLFNDTIFYNILYGRPNATRREVERAARLARIDDFITGLPDGYDSMVGERGLKLSGGEKQRVAIARAILKDPAILLFDEATSALDSRTEREIHQSIREVSRDRTALIIAHRLSTVVDADEILVLADGQTAERGRHETLLQSGGLYAEMWARQQEDANNGEAGTLPPAAPRR